MKWFLVLLALCSSSAFAAEVTGKWMFETNFLGAKDTVECRLQQSGKAVSGSCKGTQFPEAAAAGSFDEGVFRISFIYLFADQSFNCTYQGTLHGEKDMAGSIVIASIDGVTGEFKARKQ